MVPKAERAASRFRSPPEPQLQRRHLCPARRGWRRGGADSPEPPAPRPGVHNMSVPIPGKLPGVPREGGAGRLQKLSHMPFHSPHHPLSLAGPSPSPAPRHLAQPGAPGGPRRRPGGGSYLPGKFPAFGAIPHPQGRASGRGRLGARPLPLLRLPRLPLLPQLPLRRLRSGPSPRLARPTPGPHWQPESPPPRVFPKAPSSRAPARPAARPAAPPAPLPARRCGSQDPPGRGARTFRRTRAQRSPPTSPGRVPSFPQGAGP